MNGILKVFCHALCVRGGIEMVQFGGMTSPINITAYNGNFQSGPQRIKIPAGTTRQLWAYTETIAGRFAYISVAVIGSGFAWLSNLVDIPNDIVAGDYMPSGTNPMWFHEGLSCTGAKQYTSDLVLHHATPANVYAASGALPALPSDVAAVTGKIYRIAITNPGTSDIEIEWCWIGEPL